jgi:TatD DNase family protein
MFFDSHAHLDDKRFDQDRHELITGLPKRGISYVLNAGADMVSSRKSADLAAKYPFIYASVGIHPHDARNAAKGYLDQLKALARQPKVKAIGEIGLDYHYDFSPRDVQRKCFVEQLELAGQLGLPVIIHDREAHGDIMKILKENRHLYSQGVLHCFSGSWEMAKACIDLGMYIALGGTVTFKNAVKAVEIAGKIPLEYLLIETDCPYLAPHPFRGRRNDPSLVRYVAERIGEIRGTEPMVVAGATLNNAKRLFNI